MFDHLGLRVLTLTFSCTTVQGAEIPAMIHNAKSAVVEILTYDQQNQLLKTGTGFFISPNGVLLTNYHVISDANSVIAKVRDQEVYPLKSILAFSETSDVAELKFLAKNRPFLSLGFASKALEGQRVLVIGNPEGLEGTVSDGIISAFRGGGTLIQITAPISPGSSGSPVLDESGQRDRNSHADFQRRSKPELRYFGRSNSQGNPEILTRAVATRSGCFQTERHSPIVALIGGNYTIR